MSIARHALDGVTVPLVTPLDERITPRADWAIPMLARLRHAGVDSLMLLGSNGEGPLLPPDKTERFVVEVSEVWRELHPAGSVIVNVSAPGTVEMLRRAESALSADPDALVVSPPGYFRYKPDEIARHVLAVEEFGTRYAVYNIPRYANPLTGDVFAALLESRWLIGVKDSSGDPELLAQLIELASLRDEVHISQGDENALVRGIELGATGIVPGVANLAPRLCTDLFAAATAGDTVTAARHQVQVSKLTRLHRIRAGVPAVKAILRARGLIPTSIVAPPLVEASVDETTRLVAFADEMASTAVDVS